MSAVPLPDPSFQTELSDLDIVARVLEGEIPLFELIMRRYERASTLLTCSA